MDTAMHHGIVAFLFQTLDIQVLYADVIIAVDIMP